MITWHYITSDVYHAASDAQKTNDKLFFLSDTGEIYRGKQLFTESVILHSTEPTVKAIGKLYINSTTLEGRIWNGTSWSTVIRPVQAALTASDATNPVSGKAVADYVSKRIEDVTGSGNLVASVAYAEATNTLSVSMADGNTETIPMNNVAADLVYDKDTGKLQVKNASGTAIGSGINLDLERFVSAASYDHDSRTITLEFNSGDPLTINVGDLVDTYTGVNNETINMTVEGNKITANVKVSETSDNVIQVYADGLYVAPTDISGKMDKVTSANDGMLAAFDGNGNVKAAGYIGGGALLKDPSSESSATLATEAAVYAIKTALLSDIGGKIAKVESGKENEIILATADGQVKTSGTKIGGEAFAATPNSATLATEKGVQTYVAGYAVAKTNVVNSASFAAQTSSGVSDSKVASEKAVFEAMSWKATV